MVKIIASSVRKGNVLEVEGKLYVVLTAQNFHPGKGTPVTQIDMRRISDGVKVRILKSSISSKRPADVAKTPADAPAKEETTGK